MTNVRRAHPTDATAMAHIAREAYAEYVPRLDGRRPTPMDADYTALTMSAEAWVAEFDNEVIGFLVLVHQGDGMLLDSVAVLPSYQGRGAGRLLLTLAETRCMAARYERIRLYTNEAMVEHQRLYERIGYVQTHHASEHGLRRVYYSKTLRPLPAAGARQGLQ